MTDGPLPPHERPWRHPSELAAPAPEPASRSGRLLIVATATVSLVLVGVLAVTMTPDRAPQAGDVLVTSSLLAVAGPGATAAMAETFDTLAAAVGATTAMLEARGAEAAPAGAPAVPGGSGRPNTVPVPPTSGLPAPPSVAGATIATAATTAALAHPSGLASLASDGGANDGTGAVAPLSPASSALAMAGSVMVTPLGADLAVTTASALGGASGPVEAIVPSGDRVMAQAFSASDGVVFLVIVDGAPAATMAVAGSTAGDTEMYLALGGAVIPVDSSSLISAAVPEGTPIVNSDGALVGLCTNGPDGVEVLPIGSVPTVDDRPPDGAAPSTDATTTVTGPTTTDGAPLTSVPTLAPTTVPPTAGTAPDPSVAATLSP